MKVHTKLHTTAATMYAIHALKHDLQQHRKKNYILCTWLVRLNSPHNPRVIDASFWKA